MKPTIRPKTENPKPKTLRLAFVMGIWLALTLGTANLSFSQEAIESQGLHFRLLPGGTYLLGSPPQEPGRYADEALPYRVTLEAFYMAVTETTNAQYRAFLEATGHQAPLYWGDRNLNRPSQPVVGVSWHDALAFCRWLTQLTGVPHQLPTEAQWEAAARGGRTGQPYPWGSEAPDAGGVCRANFRTAGFKGCGFKFSAPVGSFPANGYGLFDMAGNVSEWCLDPYTSLGTGGPFRPGALKLLKGGSWHSGARGLRCAARQGAPPEYADGFIGFRVVRLPAAKP